MTDLRQSQATERAYLALQDAIRETTPPCAGLSLDFFFPEGNSFRSADTAIAKQICSECPLQNLCADYAITAQEPYGIWGGLDPMERQKLKR